jgi:hypothetical protein
MEMIIPAHVAPDVNHASSDDPIADRADPAIVERNPFSTGVCLPQNAQFLVQPDVLVFHLQRLVLLNRIHWSLRLANRGIGN